MTIALDSGKFCKLCRSWGFVEHRESEGNHSVLRFAGSSQITVRRVGKINEDTLRLAANALGISQADFLKGPLRGAAVLMSPPRRRIVQFLHENGDEFGSEEAGYLTTHLAAKLGSTSGAVGNILKSMVDDGQITAKIRAREVRQTITHVWLNLSSVSVRAILNLDTPDASVSAEPEALPGGLAFPRCKRCGATGVETNEWFGPPDVETPYSGQHLCDGCFDAVSADFGSGEEAPVSLEPEVVTAEDVAMALYRKIEEIILDHATNPDDPAALKAEVESLKLRLGQATEYGLQQRRKVRDLTSRQEATEIKIADLESKLRSLRQTPVSKELRSAIQR